MKRLAKLGTRRWGLVGLAALALAAAIAALLGMPTNGEQTGPREPPPAALYETQLPQVPRIDVHVHVAPQSAERAVELLGRHHVRLALNASGGAPESGLSQSIRLVEQTGGRLRPYCNIAFRGVERSGWKEYVRSTLQACHEQGAVGLKIYKSLGLGVRLSDGGLLPVDDPQLDVVFEQAGELGLPVLIHSGDPQAFFEPPTPDNERHAELQAHPGWSFHGERPDGQGPWPSWEQVFAQFQRRVGRHPRTTFIGAHFGNAAEEPERVADMLDEHPHYYIDTAARIPEVGRHDRDRMRRFFERYQDRILFGSDLAAGPTGLVLGSGGERRAGWDEAGPFFAAHWRYFESRDRRFAHPTPIQGDWTIDGLGLPQSVVEKVYWRNAARVFDLELSGSEAGGEPPR